MPANTISVTRPGRFGNPFWDVKKYGRDLCLAMFENTAQGIWDGTLLEAKSDEDVHWFYTQHHKWLERLGKHPLKAIKRELGGKHLACWCSLTVRCHADILIELANRG
jgi:hypothetical protein